MDEAVMSMALPILLSGHQRFGHSLTTFMYHECLDSMHYDKISTLKENLDEGDRLMDIYDEYVLSRTSFKRTQLDKVKKNKTDWYFGVNEAIKYGVIDEII
jgi:ATP-dependent protease ClpP protease subunit